MPNLILRFINSKSFIGSAIDFVSAGYLDHAEFGTSSGTWIGAHASGGVQERPADYCRPSLERRYALPVTQEQYDAIMGFARTQIGKGYDCTDILGILLRTGWHKASCWICSELVLAACEHGGLYLLNVLPGFTYRVTPEMLHLSPLLIGRMVAWTGRP